MTSHKWRAVLVDYDEDIFSPPGFESDLLAKEGIEWVVGQRRDPASAAEFARGADVVLVQSVRPLLTEQVIAGLDRCRCIVRLGIGYDSVAVSAATDRGILVCNVPGYCVEDVADHALALLMSSVRHIARQTQWIIDDRWDRTGARPARRMRGRTLGLIAFGQIARGVAERVRGLGLTVLAFDPYVDAATMDKYGVTKVELEELLTKSDFISVHSPLTADTYHMLSTREFDSMKEGVFIVNTSRGPLIDEAALVRALQSGKVWGVGLDVMEQEPLPPDSPLRELDNVTITPHVGANSEESVAELYRIGCEITIVVCHGRWPAGVVNPEVASNTAFSFQRE